MAYYRHAMHWALSAMLAGLLIWAGSATAQSPFPPESTPELPIQDELTPASDLAPDAMVPLPPSAQVQGLDKAKKSESKKLAKEKKKPEPVAELKSDKANKPAKENKKDKTNKNDKTAEATETPKLDPKELALEKYNQGIELFSVAQHQAARGNEKAQDRLLKEAIKYFEDAALFDPTLVEAQSNVGFSYLTLKKYKQAIIAFEKALTVNAQHLNTLNGLATTYALNNQVDLAVEKMNALTTLDPGNPDFQFNKGSVYQKAARYDEASVAYTQALKLNPRHQRALFNMGTLLENQNKLTEAKAYYNKAKGADIGNNIGLEAMKRIESIDMVLKLREQEQTGSAGSGTSSDAKQLEKSKKKKEKNS